MPYTLRLADLSTPQAWIIPDSSPFNDGLMSKKQAAELAALVAGGGGSGYNRIESAGTALPQQTTLNFISGLNTALTIVDDPGSSRTDVTVAGTNPLSLPFTDGTYMHSLQIGAVDAGVVWKIIPADPTPYCDFFFTYLSNADNPGQPNDNVFNIGQNLGPGTGQVDVTKGAVGISIESFFVAGHPQQEFHLVWWPPNTVPGPEYTQTRFLSFEGHDDDGSTAMYMFAIDTTLGSGHNANDPPSILIAPTTTTIQSPPTTLSPGLVPLAYAFATFDVGTITLGANDSSHATNAQLVLDSTGGAALTTKSVGRLLDSRNSGNPSFQWDNGSSQVLSPDNTTQLSVGNGQAALFVNSALLLAAQPTQVFIPDKLLYVKRDGGGTNTRGDTIGSLLIRNNTAATGGATQQFSPSAVLTGYGWTGSASRAVSFEMQVQPDGTGAGSYAWLYSTDEANYAQMAALSSTGALSLAAGIGAYGVSPPAQQTLGATPTGAEIRAVLVAYGLVAP